MSRQPKTYYNHNEDTDDSVGCILIDAEAKILLIDGVVKISFPKGHRKQDESSRDCAIREVWEETGLDVSNLKFNRFAKFVRCKYYYMQLPRPFETYKLKPQEGETGKVFWATLAEFVKIPRKKCNVDVAWYSKTAYQLMNR
jgi:8-oxo-dGTP pyrophosphatase MutT (NUDIX family)